MGTVVELSPGAGAAAVHFDAIGEITPAVPLACLEGVRASPFLDVSPPPPPPTPSSGITYNRTSIYPQVGSLGSLVPHFGLSRRLRVTPGRGDGPLVRRLRPMRSAATTTRRTRPSKPSRPTPRPRYPLRHSPFFALQEVSIAAYTVPALFVLLQVATELLRQAPGLLGHLASAAALLNASTTSGEAAGARGVACAVIGRMATTALLALTSVSAASLPLSDFAAAATKPDIPGACFSLLNCYFWLTLQMPSIDDVPRNGRFVDQAAAELSHIM